VNETWVKPVYITLSNWFIFIAVHYWLWYDMSIDELWSVLKNDRWTIMLCRPSGATLAIHRHLHWSLSTRHHHRCVWEAESQTKWRDSQRRDRYSVSEFDFWPVKRQNWKSPFWVLNISSCLWRIQGPNGESRAPILIGYRGWQAFDEKKFKPFSRDVRTYTGNILRKCLLSANRSMSDSK